MGDLPERRAPTHTLVVEIPLHFEAHKSAGLGAAVQDSLRIIMALSRVATEGYVCGCPQATIRDEPTPPPQDAETPEPDFPERTPAERAADEAARLKALAGAEEE